LLSIFDDKLSPTFSSNQITATIDRRVNLEYNISKMSFVLFVCIAIVIDVIVAQHICDALTNEIGLKATTTILDAPISW
jgi:hypothetical protein